MSSISGIVLALAFILGLLINAVPWSGIGILILGIALGLLRQFVPRFWRTGPQPWVWLVAGMIGLLATLYFQLRIPQPGINDISRIVPELEAVQNPVVLVSGRVETLPRRTRSQKYQFWLEASHVEPKQPIATLSGKDVNGILYVTISTPEPPEVYPGEIVKVEGRLYQPKPATNPRGFDFRWYLLKEGCFAGLGGKEVTVLKPDRAWGAWMIRQRIAQAQQKGLGDPAGPLVSAMVLGSRAVDLPFDVRDEFTRVGLAHALAASGFQTSLILGVVLSLVRGVGVIGELIAGTTSLTTFAGLSGFEPAVARATLMGIAGLLALVMGRKSKPVAILLLVSVLLLIYNPLWVWQLGFQLSVLATLGLIVTANPLAERMTWLPPTIAAMIAVPLAATLWTLPLQLAMFGVFPIYGLIVNVITTPLISLLTIGGFISALAALPWPEAGTALAWLMYYPTHLLLWIVHFFNRLPGSSLAVGSIGLWQIVVLYSLLLFLWLSPWWQRRWRWAGLMALALVLVPILQTKLTTFQATILDTSGVPVMLIQQPRSTTLINSGDATTAGLTVRSFLQQQGINQIDWAIATNTSPKYQAGWADLFRNFAVKTFSDVNPGSSGEAQSDLQDTLRQHQVTPLPLQLNQTVTVAATEITCLRADPLVMQLKLGDQTWLVFSDPKGVGQEVWLQSNPLPPVQVVWWFGKNFSPKIVQALQPQVVILSTRTVEPEVLAQLQAAKVKLYWTGRDGALQWTPNRGFEAAVSSGETQASTF